MNKSILDILCSQFDDFFESEKKIASYIMSNPNEVVNMTIKTLANKCKTSEASISRFCKKIQVESFHQLKISLAKEQISTSIKVEGDNIISLDDISHSLDNILSNKIDELKATIKNIDPDVLKKVLDLIEKARHVNVVAVGNTIPVAMDCAFKFNEIGISTVTFNTWETQVSYAFTLNKDDVLIAISNSGYSRSVSKMMDIAKENNVPCIAITNNVESVIAKKADYHLQTSTREKLFFNEYYFSRISASTMIEVLYLFLTSQRQDRIERIGMCEEVYSQEKL